MTARHSLRITALVVATLCALPCPADNHAHVPEQMPVDEPGFPTAAEVNAALARHPAILAAQAGMEAEQARERQLKAGAAETAIRVDAQRRRLTDTTERYGEWAVALERPLRLPRKAAIDEKLGAQGVQLAEATLGDARHETARALLRQWFTWLRERAQADQWQEQEALAQRQADIVARRQRLGDASRMDAGQAAAVLAQARATTTQARARERTAAAEIPLRFPGLSVPASPALPTPVPLTGTADTWRERVLDHNHELLMARAESRRASLLAGRADADTVPDPTVGVRYASERAGAERITGLMLALPFPGQARRAHAEVQQAAARAAAQREASVQRKLEAEAASAYATAVASHSAWQELRAAAEQTRANADLMERAYGYGEIGLADLLAARRNSREAQLAAVLVQLEAAEARLRLLLDTHALWPPAPADHDGHD